jgi:dolichol-phosphate mannosyltransferase
MQSALHTYDIHGIVGVASVARLPELEPFRVPALVREPEIRVQTGALPPATNGHMTPNGSRRVRYDEGFRRFGFGVEISKRDGVVDVLATPFLARSPHVLYTNVVEPVLRWTFVEKGFALVHGACLAFGEDAYLVTARTDTGKTTTVLRVLDSQPGCSFVSDDLTLVSPEGRVLTYPKPLTISRHTLVAVNTPLLTRSERLALLVQSRLHSKSGRRFGLFLTKTGLPMATTNAVVQFLVPPPKYHVQRLVPGVKLANEARLAGLIVIERGEDGEIRLSDQEALDIVMANSEDSYGFPPYESIKDFLYSSEGGDLRPVERATVASALAGKSATLLRSSTRDWWQRVPALVRGTAAQRGATAYPSPAWTPAASPGMAPVGAD